LGGGSSGRRSDLYKEGKSRWDLRHRFFGTKEEEGYFSTLGKVKLMSKGVEKNKQEEEREKVVKLTYVA